uniref:S4 domain-containing protein n=1 Tax=Kaistella sp. TaxID=2782235 RepID=UPI002F95EC03
MSDETDEFLEEDLPGRESGEADDAESAGLFEHLNIKVDRNQEPLRIDKFLFIFRQNSSRNKISQTCRAGNVVVNGKPVKQNYRVKPG